MPDQPLKDLLQQADRSAGQAPLIPTDPAEWAKHVQTRKQRRDRVRYAATGGSALTAIILVVLALTRPQPSQNPDQSFEFTANQPTVLPAIACDTQLALQAEVATHRLVVRRLLAARKQRAKTEAVAAEVYSPTSNPIADALRLAEEASLIMVVQADRMDRELGLRRSSILAYRRTMELFPTSPYAVVAQSRLDALHDQYNGGTL